MHGLILAGGEGTRLGPLGLQRSKALVSVGQRPMLVHQYQQLHMCGCDDVTIVVSPRTHEQVRQVASCAGLQLNLVTQDHAGGPVEGLLTGLVEIGDDEVIMLCADTFLTDYDALRLDPDAVLCAPAPYARSFCHWRLNQWVDELTEPDEVVFVGALRANVAELERAAWGSRDVDGVAGLLNGYPFTRIAAESWLDAGDIRALTRLNRHHFISRAFNQLHLDENGLLTKTGAVLEEGIMMTDPPAPTLYPRVFERTEDSYTMEYLPLPTLAELYLYWPRDPSMWAHITRTLLRTLAREHWPLNDQPVTDRARSVYYHGFLERYSVVLVPAPHRVGGTVRVNGADVVVGDQLTRVAAQLGLEFAHDAVSGCIHGDPNFTNVLWSIETSMFRLVDPRGHWGGPGPRGDRRYDVAKIAFSPIFARVAHGLFDVNEITPREYEITELALDSVVLNECELYCSPERLRQLVAWTLLACAPLHAPGDEATIMYLTGARMMSEWL